MLEYHAYLQGRRHENADDDKSTNRNGSWSGSGNGKEKERSGQDKEKERSGKGKDKERSGEATKGMPSLKVPRMGHSKVQIDSCYIDILIFNSFTQGSVV